MPAQPPKLAVIVTGPSQALLRRFLGRYVKMPFGLHRCQVRKKYREEYGLTVLSRLLPKGADPQELYGPHEANAVLVLAALPQGAPGSTLAEARAWLKAKGFSPVAELAIAARLKEFQYIELGAEVVNFVNVRCPWRNEEIADIDAYIAQNNKPFWA